MVVVAGQPAEVRQLLNISSPVPAISLVAHPFNYLQVVDKRMFSKCAAECAVREFGGGMSITIRMDAFSVEHPFVGSDPSGFAGHVPDLRRVQLCPKILILHFGVSSGTCDLKPCA
jgi:hypothetical protein